MRTDRPRGAGMQQTVMGYRGHHWLRLVLKGRMQLDL